MPFKYTCYNDLQDKLGYIDATNNMLEISIKYFQTLKISESELIAKAKADGIILDCFDINRVFQNVRNNYLITTYQYFEEFLNNFRDEHNKLFAKKIEFEDKKSKLNSLLNSLKKIIAINELELIIEYLEYYRLVRNYLVHKNNKTKENCHELYKRIIENDYLNIIKSKDKRNELENFINDNVKMPNNYDKISYEDFYNFTILIKKLSFIISSNVQPSNDELLNLIKGKKKFNNIKNNEIRYKNAISGFLSNEYGYSFDEAKSIIEKIDLLA